MGKLKEKLARMREDGTDNQSVEQENVLAKKKQVTYRKGSKFISLDEAKKLRWAHKSTGQPTKIYDLVLAKRQAKKNGEQIPVRKWISKNPNQVFNGIESPYVLTRRSGQRLIWQELAKTPNEVVSRKDMQERVNIAYKKEFPEFYESHYSDEAQFDTWITAIIMNRAPFNARIEAIAQRVDVDTVAETIILKTNVTTPRVNKKRGRKPGTKNKVN